MKIPCTSLKARYRQDFRKVLSQKRSRIRLTGFNVNTVKISATVKRIVTAFKDHECILNAWNSLPSLFYFRGKIEKLIDAKYLAAIQKLKYLQTGEMQLSEIELYYSWLLFQNQMGQFNTSLISLTSFYEFQESWRALNIPYNNLICTDYHALGESSDDIDELEVEDPNQLNIHFY